MAKYLNDLSVEEHEDLINSLERLNENQDIRLFLTTNPHSEGFRFYYFKVGELLPGLFFCLSVKKSDSNIQQIKGEIAYLFRKLNINKEILLEIILGQFNGSDDIFVDLMVRHLRQELPKKCEKEITDLSKIIEESNNKKTRIESKLRELTVNLIPGIKTLDKSTIYSVKRISNEDN